MDNTLVFYLNLFINFSGVNYELFGKIKGNMLCLAFVLINVRGNLVYIVFKMD